MSQKAVAYRIQAEELKVLSTREGSVPTPYAGGLTISGKETDRDNSDRIQPYFSSGQFTNKDEGGIKAQSSVE